MASCVAPFDFDVEEDSLLALLRPEAGLLILDDARVCQL